MFLHQLAFGFGHVLEKRAARRDKTDKVGLRRGLLGRGWGWFRVLLRIRCRRGEAEKQGKDETEFHGITPSGAVDIILRFSGENATRTWGERGAVAYITL
jgi:hypothetical protein